MSEKALKLKKGGLDTIIAYIVVMLPLLYVLVYIIATIYHFSVQMYMNQVVKEATVMASTYGALTTEHAKYIEGNLDEILPIFYVAGSQTLPPPLSPEEEEETIKKLDTDECIEAKKLLVERNLRLVVYIAKKFETTAKAIT